MFPVLSRARQGGAWSAPQTRLHLHFLSLDPARPLAPRFLSNSTIVPRNRVTCTPRLQPWRPQPPTTYTVALPLSYLLSHTHPPTPNPLLSICPAHFLLSFSPSPSHCLIFFTYFLPFASLPSLSFLCRLLFASRGGLQTVSPFFFAFNRLWSS